MEQFKIGIDLGGTKTEVILLDSRGNEVKRERRPTPAREGYEAILDNIVALVDDLLGALPSGAEYSLGMGIPGIIDGESGVVENANTTLMIGKPLRDDMKRLMGRAVAIENDANCFTMAEAKSGAGRGYDSVFGIIMGTGCGGGVYLNGSVRNGPHGIAGEWGHVSLDPNGRRCWCGNRGCIETMISGSGVENGYEERFGSRLSMKEIVERFRGGDDGATIVMEQFFEDFGRALGGLISILDPDAVVLGGGLSLIDELYTTGVERVRKYAFHRRLRTPILKNEMGDSAGVFGAAWIGI